MLNKNINIDNIQSSKHEDKSKRTKLIPINDLHKKHIIIILVHI